jgi:diaminopimelate decarboxylase
MHIGSQITSIEPFRDAFELLASLVEDLRRDGHTISFVNLGGGLGIPYRWDQDDPPLPADYAKVAVEVAKRLGTRLLFEPGRVITGNAGLLVTRVIYIKQGAGKRFVIADVGMNDLVRPTLYDAYHDIWPVSEALKQGPMSRADLVGPVCETGDFIAKDRPLPEGLAAGGLLAIMTAGAYGAVQSSAYNSRRLIPEVLVSGADYAVVRPRPSYEDMLKTEIVAPWLR